MFCAIVHVSVSFTLSALPALQVRVVVFLVVLVLLVGVLVTVVVDVKLDGYLMHFEVLEITDDFVPSLSRLAC